jgi:excisionase family DNA binding protein
MPKSAKKENVVPFEKFFHSRKEAACALAISVRSIDYLISEQKLRTHRFKRRVLIPSEDVKRVADEIMRSER